MASPRSNIGIAIDGGGIKGVLAAHGIIALEKLLGAPDRPLITHPHLKVLAGTSTGALITSALAIGLTGREILGIYEELGKTVFSKAERLRLFGRAIFPFSLVRLPAPWIRAIERLPAGEFLLYMLMAARYSIEPLRAVAQEALLKQHQRGFIPFEDPTMEELGTFLRSQPGQPTLIITAVEVGTRQTHFIKTTSTERLKKMKVVDAILASSIMPTYWLPLSPDVLPPAADGKKRALVDGGVGNFGNPALVAAWELASPHNTNVDPQIDPPRHHDPATVTVFSFGTGTVGEAAYLKRWGSPFQWWALNWAARVIDLFGDSAIREQSRDVVAQYAGIDLRRFQLALDKPISADDVRAIPLLKEKGEELLARVAHNQHALVDKQFDPEGIWHR